MPRAVREVDPTSLGSGARLREFIKLGTKDYVAWIVIRGMFRHWHVTLSVLLIFVLWFAYGSFSGVLWALATVIGAWLSGLCVACYLYGGNWKSPLYYLRVKRGWRNAIYGVGLRHRERDFKLLPLISRIRPVRGGIRFNVNMAHAGRTVNDLRAEADDICEILGFRQVQVFPLKPGRARVIMLATDETTIPSSSISSGSDLDLGGRTVDATEGYAQAVFGRTPSGDAILLLVVSVLIVGLSNSGKTNLLKAIFHALLRQKIPHQLYIIDDKGGVSFTELEHYPNTLSYCTNAKDAENVLRHAVRDMWARAEHVKKRGSKDKLHPSAEFPLRIIFIDELLLLQKSIKEGVEGDLGILLTVGREFLFIVIALSQGSQVDLLGRMRDLFPQRLCLATPSPETTDACLGKGAEEKYGAKCSEIPLSTPGVGYQRNYDGRGFTRFRASEVVGSLLTNVEGYDKPDHGIQRRCAVYRYYNLAGRALYFGKSFDPQRRAKEESASCMWWPNVDHTRTKIDWYATEADALKMEKLFIKEEDPVENKRLRNLSPMR